MPLTMDGGGTNLFSILINIAFGFVGGLMIFLGAAEVLAYGSQLAGDLIKLSGYGQQIASFGFATTAAPYIVLAPIAGIVIKQLTAVRTIKGFLIFAATILVGVVVAYFAQGSVAGLM